MRSENARSKDDRGIGSPKFYIDQSESEPVDTLLLFLKREVMVNYMAQIVISDEWAAYTF